ncbi:hypothetical protein A0H81_02143 [Grifola frondosa]|uniref:DUF6533 domain-containing protein n=1 Tax=Grifola frondosa TaxID=5627 RepID=A0A1C7MNJ4_GRIFR|nr:hypothetical protein A0H81_02143 [Grifola frondosa]
MNDTACEVGTISSGISQFSPPYLHNPALRPAVSFLLSPPLSPEAATNRPPELATIAENLIAAKMFSLASCVMLFYDIAITFGDEVEKIWKQRFTGATVLWFLNRYISPLGYIVIIVSFHDPNWGKAACDRYVLYPEVLKIFTAFAIGVIFILRLYSIYAKSRYILYSFSALLVAELAVKIWAFTDGTSLMLPPGLVGCILTGKSASGKRFVYTWVAELVFDSSVFFATLYRTIYLYRRTYFHEALSLIAVIMRDGIMYFAAIFVSNLVTVLIFILAPEDLKAINASFSTLITSLMVSRLMLNLRAEVMRRGPVMQQSRESSIIGNLGAPVITWEGDQDDQDLLKSGGEALEMRVQPSQVFVQVTEEVIVEQDSPQPPQRARGDMRRSWMPPSTWRLSREQSRGQDPETLRRIV